MSALDDKSILNSELDEGSQRWLLRVFFDSKHIDRVFVAHFDRMYLDVVKVADRELGKMAAEKEGVFAEITERHENQGKVPLIPYAAMTNGDVLFRKEFTPGAVWKVDVQKREAEQKQGENVVQPVWPQIIPMISAEDEKLIREAAELLKNPRSLDNTYFRGREISPQENETLDLIVQVQKHLERDKTALAKINEAGISPWELGKQHLGRKGFGPLKGCEVIARTQNSAVLLQGRRLYIYGLKLMELQPPATALNQGDKVNLIWPFSREKAKVQVNPQQCERKQGLALARALEEKL